MSEGRLRSARTGSAVAAWYRDACVCLVELVEPWAATSQGDCVGAYAYHREMKAALPDQDSKCGHSHDDDHYQPGSLSHHEMSGLIFLAAFVFLCLPVGRSLSGSS
jgi:hypothetical protein